MFIPAIPLGDKISATEGVAADAHGNVFGAEVPGMPAPEGERRPAG